MMRAGGGGGGQVDIERRAMPPLPLISAMRRRYTPRFLGPLHAAAAPGRAATRAGARAVLSLPRHDDDDRELCDYYCIETLIVGISAT